MKGIGDSFVGSDSSMHVKILILIINLNSILIGFVYIYDFGRNRCHLVSLYEV